MYCTIVRYDTIWQSTWLRPPVRDEILILMSKASFIIMASTQAHNDDDNGDYLSKLDRAIKTPGRHQQQQVAAYRKRLSSFSTTTYFAKPASLSPLVCARFG